MKKLLLLIAIATLFSCTTEPVITNSNYTEKGNGNINYAPLTPTIYCGECKGVESGFNSSNNLFVGWRYVIELVPPVSGNNRLRFLIPYTGIPTIYSDSAIYGIGQNICSTGGTNYEFLYFP